jgi:hypothetical protein
MRGFMSCIFVWDSRLEMSPDNIVCIIIGKCISTFLPFRESMHRTAPDGVLLCQVESLLLVTCYTGHRRYALDLPA